MSNHLSPGWFFSETESCFSYLVEFYGCLIVSCHYDVYGYDITFKNEHAGIQVILDREGYLSIDLYKVYQGMIAHVEIKVPESQISNFARINVQGLAKYMNAFPHDFISMTKLNESSIRAGLKIQSDVLADIGKDFLLGNYDKYSGMFNPNDSDT